MLIGELILKKDDIKDRIHELREFIFKLSNNSNKNNAEIYGQSLGILFDLLDQYQNYLVVIENSNTLNNVTIGNNEVSVSNAVKIRDTLRCKIDALEDIISGSDYFIDKLSLMNKKNKLKDECSIIDNIIYTSDWSTLVE